MKSKKKLGKEGEQAAEKYLIAQGYSILGRNIHIGHDEVDILAKDGNMLVFVEVKTRAVDSYGVPQDFITPQKEACLIRCADRYISDNEYDGETRFDVIAIHWAGRKRILRHFPDAFYPLA